VFTLRRRTPHLGRVESRVSEAADAPLQGAEGAPDAYACSVDVKPVLERVGER
jgi:hypothetical protein